jgi:hypothetical protein
MKCIYDIHRKRPIISVTITIVSFSTLASAQPKRTLLWSPRHLSLAMTEGTKAVKDDKM